MPDEDKPPVYQHPVLDYPTRAGNWCDQQRSTYDLCLQALREKRWGDAAALAAHTIHEAREPHELYVEWADGIRAYMQEAGVDHSTIAAEEAALLGELRNEDGSPFDPEDGWRRANSHIKTFLTACDAQDEIQAGDALESSRKVWEETHDRKCDWVQGLLAIAARCLGEERIGPIWDRLMVPIFKSYEKYDVDLTPWSISSELLLQVTVDSLRGHLTGENRRGEITYVEEEKRRGFRFTPCGAGGRNFKPGAKRFPLTEAEHSWAWNMKGVCLYCVHCCTVSEQNPIRRYGYPAREIEPPFENSEGRRDYCTWWVYDNPGDVPEEVYRRTGNTKPSKIGGAATTEQRMIRKEGDRE